MEVSDLIDQYHTLAAQRAATRARCGGVSGVTGPAIDVFELSFDDEVVPTRVSKAGITVPTYRVRAGS